MKTSPKQAFAHRLNALMRERGWTQSDLARRAFGTYSDPKTGYILARKRERINKYVRGEQIPDPENLSLLAAAFGLTVDELIAVEAAPPQLRLIELADQVAAVEEALRRMAQDLPPA